MPEFAALFWKELSQFSNRRRFVLENLAYISVLAFLFLCEYLTPYFYGAGIFSDYPPYSRMVSIGREVFTVGAIITSIILGFAALFLGADILSREVVRGTLVFLVITPLNATLVLAAKLAAVVARVFLGLVVLLPIIALASNFGGFNSIMVVFAVASILANVLLYACMGLAAATARYSRTDALGRAFAIAFIFNFAAFVAMVLPMRGRGFSPTCAPFFMAGTFQFAGPWSADFAPFLNTLPFLVLIAAAFFFSAAWFFRRNALSLVSPVSPRDRMRHKPGRLQWRIFPRVSRLASRLIPPGMILRELSAWRLGAVIALPAVYAALIITALCVLRAERRHLMTEIIDREPQCILFMLNFVVLNSILAIQASRRIVAEREARTLQLLGISGLGPLGILAGKAAAVLVTQAPAILVLFLQAVCLSMIHAIPPTMLPLVLLVIMLSLVTAVALGLYLSLAARKQAVGVLIMLFGAPYFFSGLIVPFNAHDYGEQELTGSLLLGCICAPLACFFPRIARKWAPGMISALAALGAVIWPAFCLKTFLVNEDLYGHMVYEWWFLPGPAGYPPVLAVAPLLLFVTLWLVWVMTSSFESHLRRCA